MNEEYIKREAIMRSMEFITKDTTCPIHIAAYIDQIIAQEPAADVVEVRHGEWIADDKFDNGKSSIFHCSECYYSRATSVLYTAEKLAVDDPYCKKCGAKMDRKGES